MIDLKKLLSLQASNIIDWHNELILSENDIPWVFIEENNKWNFQLWHEEDIARIKDIDPLRIVEAKRNIDKFNQARNNAMEKIDEYILDFLATNNITGANKLHSETPGMMIDRLSIMQLKRYHMQEEVKREDASEEHKLKCIDRVNILDEQIKDLSNCLKDVLAQIEIGALKFKVYRQLKMYNDPSLNPQLYTRNLIDVDGSK